MLQDVMKGRRTEINYLNGPRAGPALSQQKGCGMSDLRLLLGWGVQTSQTLQ